MTNKKVVFISYAHEELALAEALKNGIQEIWPDCTVFISASHESIRPGEYWRNKLKDEIPRADVFFSLIGPSTQERPWIHLEAGAAWALGKRRNRRVTFGLLEGCAGVYRA